MRPDELTQGLVPIRSTTPKSSSGLNRGDKDHSGTPVSSATSVQVRGPFRRRQSMTMR